MNNNTEITYKTKRSTSITRFRHRCRQMFDLTQQNNVKRLVFYLFKHYSLKFT